MKGEGIPSEKVSNEGKSGESPVTISVNADTLINSEGPDNQKENMETGSNETETGSYENETRKMKRDQNGRVVITVENHFKEDGEEMDSKNSAMGKRLKKQKIKNSSETEVKKYTVKMTESQNIKKLKEEKDKYNICPNLTMQDKNTFQQTSPKRDQLTSPRRDRLTNPCRDQLTGEMTDQLCEGKQNIVISQGRRKKVNQKGKHENSKLKDMKENTIEKGRSYGMNGNERQTSNRRDSIFKECLIININE